MKYFNRVGYLPWILMLLCGCIKSRDIVCPVSTNDSTLPTTTKNYQVSTLAGSGSKGYIDSFATFASFDLPAGVAVDSSGNVYVADSQNDVIRKITPSGIVTTYAGFGTAGHLDTARNYALFNKPYDLTIDSVGNIYIADLYNNCIRKIAPSGFVITLAGSTTNGFVNGTGTAASFSSPSSVAVDGFGNVYVADLGNNVIRKITSGGVVTTFAGSGIAGASDGIGTSASFNHPFGVAIDKSGNIYVSDRNNNLIRKITQSAVVTTFAGSGVAGFKNGIGRAASFNNPYQLSVDASGNIYVADFGNNVIREITPSGVVTTLAGTGTVGSTNGAAIVASFNGPTGVAVGLNGYIYVADNGNQLIRKIVP